MVYLHQILSALNSLAPWDIAESYDHVGLQVGNKNMPVKRVLAAVDLNREVLDEGIGLAVDGFIVHHPLFFKPFFQVDPASGVGFYLNALLKNDLFLVASHTNLDSSVQGLNRYIAQRLQLKELTTIESIPGDQYKIVVFVPESHLETVRNSMASAGAGIIGNYSECSFEIRGNGTFRPNHQARPYLGEPGVLETTAEVRLEMVVHRRNLAGIMDSIRKNHPYEEPAFDIYPLFNESADGLGCSGVFDSGLRLTDLCRMVQRELGAKYLRVTGDSSRKVQRLAVCTGSGRSILSKVAQQGANAYLTGELNYHDLLFAKEAGLAVIEAGHWTTERCFIPLITGYLEGQFGNSGDFQVISSAAVEAEPYQILTL